MTFPGDFARHHTQVHQLASPRAPRRRLARRSPSLVSPPRRTRSAAAREAAALRPTPPAGCSCRPSTEMAEPAPPWELHLRGMGGDVHGGCSCLEAVLAAARQRGAPLARLKALGVYLGTCTQGEQRQVEQLAAALKGGVLFPAMR